MAPSKKRKRNSVSPTAEANERELFLQAFEKPTQIYRYLRNRHFVYPVFLNRNLAYMRHRFLRNHKSRASFKVDDMLASMRGRETKSHEFLRISYKGIFDTTGFSNLWWNPGNAVSMEVVLCRIVKNKRKESATDMQEIWKSSTNVIYNPHDETEVCSVINIPFQSLTPRCDGNSTYKLHFHIQVSNYNIKTLNKKVTRNAPAPSGRPELPKHFGCELTIYENECGHTPDGAYEVAMHEIFSPSKISATRKRSWVKKSEGGEPLSLKVDLFNREAAIKFYLDWGLNEYSILDAKKLIKQELIAIGTESNFSISESVELTSDKAEVPNMNQNNNCVKGNFVKREKLEIVYNFLYNNNNCQQTEHTQDLVCPWCNIDCVRLLSFFKHLKLCHGRFNFNFQQTENGASIDVTINDSYDGSHDFAGPSGSVFARAWGPVKRATVTNLLVCRPHRQKHGMDEFIELKAGDVNKPRSHLKGHNRLYHHTGTWLPVHFNELDIDSEGEGEPQWLRQRAIRKINEFTDVNEGEKELMKLWSLHVKKHGFSGDCQLPLACEMFLDANGRDIIRKNLFGNFIQHMCLLFEHGLLSSEFVYETVQKLHDILRKYPEGQKMVAKHHEAKLKYWVEVGMHKPKPRRKHGDSDGSFISNQTGGAAVKQEAQEHATERDAQPSQEEFDDIYNLSVKRQAQ